MDASSKLNDYKAKEADRVRSYAKNAGMNLPEKYASGGGVKGKGAKTNITIIIGKDQQQKPDMGGLAALAAASRPKPPPVVLPPSAPPPQANAGPPPGAPGLGGLQLPGMKRGGRATALPMTAGSMSGPGREEKSASEAKKEGRAAKPTPKKKA